MPLPIIADVYRCALDWGVSASPTQATNVIHLRRSSGNESDVFADLDASVTANMWRHTGGGMAVQRVTIQKLDGMSAGGVFTTGAAAKWTGSATGGDLIPAACAIVKLTTALRGRTYRGRVYLPFVIEGAQQGGYLSSSNTGPMQTAWTAFLAAVASAGSTLVVASYALDSAEDVTGASVETPMGTQRRRQPRV